MSLNELAMGSLAAKVATQKAFGEIDGSKDQKSNNAEVDSDIGESRANLQPTEVEKRVEDIATKLKAHEQQLVTCNNSREGAARLAKDITLFKNTDDWTRISLELTKITRAIELFLDSLYKLKNEDLSILRQNTYHVPHDTQEDLLTRYDQLIEENEIGLKDIVSNMLLITDLYIPDFFSPTEQKKSGETLLLKEVIQREWMVLEAATHVDNLLSADISPTTLSISKEVARLTQKVEEQKIQWLRLRISYIKENAQSSVLAEAGHGYVDSAVLLSRYASELLQLQQLNRSRQRNFLTRQDRTLVNVMSAEVGEIFDAIQSDSLFSDGSMHSWLEEMINDQVEKQTLTVANFADSLSAVGNNISTLTAILKSSEARGIALRSFILDGVVSRNIVFLLEDSKFGTFMDDLVNNASVTLQDLDTLDQRLNQLRSELASNTYNTADLQLYVRNSIELVRTLRDERLPQWQAEYATAMKQRLDALVEDADTFVPALSGRGGLPKTATVESSSFDFDLSSDELDQYVHQTEAKIREIIENKYKVFAESLTAQIVSGDVTIRQVEEFNISSAFFDAVEQGIIQNASEVRTILGLAIEQWAQKQAEVFQKEAESEPDADEVQQIKERVSKILGDLKDSFLYESYVEDKQAEKMLKNILSTLADKSTDLK